MQKMLRIVSILVCVFLLSSVITACGKAGNDNAATTVKEGSSAQTSTVAPTQAKKDHIDVTIWGHDLNFPEGDRIVKFIEDKFNVGMKFVSYPWGTYQEKLRTSIQAGEVPEMFPSNGPGDTNTMYDQLYNEGLLMDMTDLIDKYPNLKKAVNYDPDTLKFLKNGDKLFGVPRTWNKDTTDRVIFYRADWIEKLGLKVPDTWDEVYTVLKAFKEAKPDGQNQVGLSFNDPWWIEQIVAGFTGVSGYYKDESGKYVAAAYHPKRKEAFKYLNKLYKEGLLDPECYVSKAERPKEYFVSGRSGMIYNASQYASCFPYFDETKKNFPNAKVKILDPIPAGPDGTRAHVGIDSGYFGMYCFNKDFKDAERMVEIMDYLASPEGNSLVRDGIEGIHYTLQDGKKVFNTAECEKDQFRSKGVTSHYISYLESIDFTFNQDMTVPYAEDIFTPSNDIGKKYSARNPVQGFADESLTQFGGSISDIERSYESKFVTGQLDIDSKWDEMLAKMKAVDNGAIETAVNKYMEKYK
jgi:ABC-type sugar transport system, periplasmic component